MAHAKVTFEGNSHQPVALVRKEQASGPGPALRSPRPVLVLDDLHTLHDRDDIESDLGWLAEHLPNNVRLTDWRVRERRKPIRGRKVKVCHQRLDAVRRQRASLRCPPVLQFGAVQR